MQLLPVLLRYSSLCVAMASVWWFGGKRRRPWVSRRDSPERHRAESAGQVRYHGVRVGRVESIRFNPKDSEEILIRVSVNEDIPLTGDSGQAGLSGTDRHRPHPARRPGQGPPHFRSNGWAAPYPDAAVTDAGAVRWRRGDAEAGPGPAGQSQRASQSGKQGAYRQRCWRTWSRAAPICRPRWQKPACCSPTRA